jgi:hypothetical protein
MCFVDLEKAFDRVPRKVIEWALRKKQVNERLVGVVMRMYEGGKNQGESWKGDVRGFLTLKLGFTKDRCYHLFCLQL